MTPTDTARRPRRDAIDNRAGILATAAATLGHDPHASIDTIARGAGLSRRALYGHFADRDALLRDLIADGARRCNDIAAAVDDTDAPVALGMLAARLWSAAAHVQVLAAIALDDAHVEQTAAALAPLRRAVLAVVRRGQHDGTLRTDVAAATLARLVEETARTVISRVDASSPDAKSLAVRATLSIGGLSWRESESLLARRPDILEEQ